MAATRAPRCNTYHSFRIQSIIRTNNGTLIAFAKDRRWNPSDYGDLNLVFKRSPTMAPPGPPWMKYAANGPGTWGNPTAVYDANNGIKGRYGYS